MNRVLIGVTLLLTMSALYAEPVQVGRAFVMLENNTAHEFVVEQLDTEPLTIAPFTTITFEITSKTPLPLTNQWSYTLVVQSNITSVSIDLTFTDGDIGLVTLDVQNQPQLSSI